MGETRVTTLLAVFNVASPLLVPMKPVAPERSNNSELGKPGRKIGDPATGGVLLASIGISGMLEPGTLGKVLVA